MHKEKRPNFLYARRKCTLCHSLGRSRLYCRISRHYMRFHCSSLSITGKTYYLSRCWGLDDIKSSTCRNEKDLDIPYAHLGKTVDTYRPYSEVSLKASLHTLYVLDRVFFSSCVVMTYENSLTGFFLVSVVDFRINCIRVSSPTGKKRKLLVIWAYLWQRNSLYWGTLARGRNLWLDFDNRAL